jgi:tRNA pseudouridine38-40 synthase
MQLIIVRCTKSSETALRIALGIEYDGTDFLGWQRLSHGANVQGTVEEALSFVADIRLR